MSALTEAMAQQLLPLVSAMGPERDPALLARMQTPCDVCGAVSPGNGNLPRLGGKWYCEAHYLVSGGPTLEEKLGLVAERPSTATDALTEHEARMLENRAGGRLT